MMIKADKLSIHNGKMSLNKRTQDWSVGNKVKVGFMTLEVVEYNGLAYVLKSDKGLMYEFEAHKGLTRK